MNIIDIYSIENLDDLYNTIVSSDFVQFRDKTADDLGISVDDLTDIAEYLKIPKLSINELAGRYTREQLIQFISEKDEDKQPRIQTAKDLNISIYVLRQLAKELGLSRNSIGRPRSERNE